MMQGENKPGTGLVPYLSPRAAWALALGTSVGWGSLVVTTNTYLSQAGPLGSALGIAIGGLIMLVIARNYHYMINCKPDAGGAYAFSRDAFGYDHGFLTAWFLALTYLAMLWANATSLPLFARIFMGEGFEVGYLYSLFGYDVYLGEALLSIAAIALIAILCMRFKKAAANLLVAMVVLFSLGIIACFAVAVFQLDIPIEPLFIPDANAFSQVVLIACISPWAFVGFESISHASEEFAFPHKRVFTVLAVAVGSSMLFYICVTLLSVTAFPPEYANWLDYVNDLSSLSGIAALPPFYATYHFLGDAGIAILMISLLCLIATSLIGNMLALSRLVFSLGSDRILPSAIAQLNTQAIPWKAVLAVAAFSAVMPFFGRVAIGWVVDITTIGAVIIYGFVSAATWKTARFRGDTLEMHTGLAGLVVMIGFGLYLLVPNLFTSDSMATESYFLFVIWAILGFAAFRLVIRRDTENRFGGSIVVWVGLLSLVLFVSLVWMGHSTMDATTAAMQEIQQHYSNAGTPEIEEDFAAQRLEQVRIVTGRSILVVVGLFALSLGVLISNYAAMSRRARRTEAQLHAVVTAANTDPLTGVKSKHAFSERENAVNQKISAGTMEAFAVAVCDVNGLKYVNDTYGHKAGDEYIREASMLICRIFQHSPVFRIGGDEFVALLMGGDYERRAELMDELDRRVEANIAIDAVVVAGGLAEFAPSQDANLHTVFERADTEMYKRKRELKDLGARTR